MESDFSDLFGKFRRRSRLSTESLRSAASSSLAAVDEQSDSLDAAEDYERKRSRSHDANSNGRSNSEPSLPTVAQRPTGNSFFSTTSKHKTFNDDPIGLRAIALPSEPTADFIFIHGLDGGSFSTWSWEHDPNKMWLRWLPYELEVATARLWTFGYKASIDGQSNSLTIQDFAKDLLFKLTTSSHPGIPIGHLPIVFIAHSMGGLVAKKAYTIGRQNDDYKSLTANVKAMIFLGTPHRGGKNVEVLGGFLKTLGMSKKYIQELKLNSTFLQSITEDFTQVCKDLRLFSFYETKKTNILKSIGGSYDSYVVDKMSGILHLPNETSNAMAANHHNVCKFESTADSRYRDVLNVLIQLVKFRFNREQSSSFDEWNFVTVGKVSELLSIEEKAVDENLSRLLTAMKTGTCQWIMDKDWFISWLQDGESDVRVLWISGAPAAGKSVLAAYIVSKIRETYGNEHCQYHAFDYLDKIRRSASYLLRSFAYQIASSQPALRLKLGKIADTFGVTFLNMSATLLWERVFRGAIFSKIGKSTFYWIIDGLDEAESEAVAQIFQFLKAIPPGVKIRVLLVSRFTSDIEMRVSSLAPLKHAQHRLRKNDTAGDIRRYVEDTIGTRIPRGVLSKQDIIGEVLHNASGNFLWITLATKDLEQSWHRQADIEKALKGFHGGMKPRYQQMMEKIDHHSEHKRRMATVFLIWATYAFRPLQITELKEATTTEFRDLTSFEDTIASTCGDFVQLGAGKMTLVHATARHYLMNNHPPGFTALRSATAHEHIVETCLGYLSSTVDRNWRQILNTAEIQQSWARRHSTLSPPDIRETWPFLSYAATFWTYHLSLADAASSQLSASVLAFFENNVYTWINTLGFLGDLKALVKAAKYLKIYVKNRERLRALHSTSSESERSTGILKIWALDLIKLVGKFGSNLTQSPSTIYKLIPPFCPASSMLRRVSEEANFTIIGDPSVDWDDCHARLSVGTEGSGRRVVATSEMFAALVPLAQSLVVWRADTCEEIQRLKHHEYVTEVAINRKGDIVCTAGQNTAKIWELSTGQQLAALRHHSDDRILAVGFGADEDQILFGYQDHLIVCQNWKRSVVEFKFFAVLSNEPIVHNGLRVVSFSPDGTKLVVGSRNRPVDLWDLAKQSRITRCITRDEEANDEDDVFLQPEVVQWHPTLGSIYILYHDTTLIHWNYLYEQKTEHSLGAKGMVCSPCGRYLLTYNADGSVKVFGLSDNSQSQPSNIHLVYHLQHPEHVRDIAFAPDGHRFYDLRDSVCSIWEPEVLITADAADRDSDRPSPYESASLSITPKTAAGSGVAPITAIACAPNDSGFCTGHDDSAISVHEMETGTKIRSLPGHARDAAIIGLTWSPSGSWIASADDAGHVLVRKVAMPTGRDQKMTVCKSSDFRISNEGINQLLFSSNDRFLLVSTLSVDRMWDVRERRICRSHEHQFPRRLRWIEHPSDPRRLVSIEAGEVHIFDWLDFTELTPSNGLRLVRANMTAMSGRRELGDLHADETVASSLDATVRKSATTSTVSQLEVRSVTQTQDKRSIVFETLPHEGYERDRVKRRRIEFIRANDLVPAQQPRELVPELSNPEFTRQMSRLVCSYQNRLVFFNHQHWVCTWKIGSAIESHKKHFFLPKDWVSTEALRLIVLSDHGTLLCPREGHVAIIKNGIKL